MEAGIPREVTVAPRVALVVVIEAEVGVVRVGTAFAAHFAPSQVVPAAQLAVAVAVASCNALL